MLTLRKSTERDSAATTARINAWTAAASTQGPLLRPAQAESELPGRIARAEG